MLGFRELFFGLAITCMVIIILFGFFWLAFNFPELTLAILIMGLIFLLFAR
jgi:hypothetical protein